VRIFPEEKIMKRVLLLSVTLVISSCGWLDQGKDPDRILFSGNIELRQVDLAFKVPGRIVALLVEEGETIMADSVVARLDSDQLISRRRQAEARLKSTQSRFSEMEAQIRFQRENVRAQIAERKAHLQQAQAALKRSLSGSRQQEIRTAQAAVSRAEAEFERASSDWKRAQELFRSEDISRAQYEKYQAAFESSEALQSEAVEHLKLVEEGPRKEDIEISRAAVAQAEAGLELANSLKLDIKRSEKVLQTLRSEIDAAEAEIAVIDAQLKDDELRSPITGVILVKTVEEGEIVGAGTSIVTVGDLENPWIRGYLTATDLGRVKLGQEVQVGTDSFPGKKYQGRVAFIASEAEFTPKQIQSSEERVKLVYRIKVDIANPNQELKLNMPVDAEIAVE
jgi:HlyD family secretion protein